MVLMNLLTGQQWRHGHRGQTYGHGAWGRKERVGSVGKVMWKHTLLLLLLLRHFSRVQLCATPSTAARQAPPSLGLSRQEHWSGLSCLSPVHESEKLK